jgi:hypothetical protein
MSIFRRKDDLPGADDRPEEEPGEPPAAPDETLAPVPTPRGTLVPRPLGGAESSRGGRIVAPRNGETLSGVVDIEVQAAEIGGEVVRIEIEYSTDGERWRSVGSVQDEPYDLRAVLDPDTPPLHVAVIRSWRLAQYFRLVLEGPELGFERVDVTSSDAEPWDLAPRPGSTWNTNGLGDGTYRLRARTVGPGGVGLLTPDVTVTVDNRAPDVRLVAPSAGAELEGTVTLVARAEDAGSYVEQVIFEYSPDAGESWREVAVREEAPWETEWDVEDVPVTRSARPSAPRSTRARRRSSSGRSRRSCAAGSSSPPRSTGPSSSWRSSSSSRRRTVRRGSPSQARPTSRGRRRSTRPCSPTAATSCAPRRPRSAAARA